MKRKIILTVLTAVLLLTAAALLGGCSQWKLPYEDFDRDGYTISVRFDANGGVFAGTKDVYVVDVFHPDEATDAADGKKEFALMAPNDDRRGSNAFGISKPKCFFAGWYTERTPRVNEGGEPLDDYGVPTAVSGRPQGYVYGGRWDFATDRLRVDPNGSYSSAESVLTLYAAWIPYFSFEIYAEGENGEFSLLDTVEALEMKLPHWNESNGKLNMEDFPKVNGKTFTGAYADPALTTAFADLVGGFVDYERGIAATEKIAIYTTWRDGEWYRIYNAKQFYQNSGPKACFELMADLDFAGQVWAPSLANNAFLGVIEGNGHKISNVSVVQANTKQTAGGLFGSLGGSAVIHNVTFENITYTLGAGSLTPGASFGLLAGKLSEGARLEAVAVSGTLLIAEGCYPNADYSVGLLFGAGVHTGMDLSGITCELVPDAYATTTPDISVDAVSGVVTLTFTEKAPQA